MRSSPKLRLLSNLYTDPYATDPYSGTGLGADIPQASKRRKRKRNSPCLDSTTKQESHMVNLDKIPVIHDSNSLGSSECSPRTNKRKRNLVCLDSTAKQISHRVDLDKFPVIHDNSSLGSSECSPRTNKRARNRDSVHLENSTTRGVPSLSGNHSKSMLGQCTPMMAHVNPSISFDGVQDGVCNVANQTENLVSVGDSGANVRRGANGRAHA